jgi:hypothetical protein
MDIKKQKQDRAAIEASEVVYKGYAPILSLCSDIEISLLLACNDVIVEPLVKEVAELHSRLSHLKNLYGKVKNNQHLNEYSKKVLPYLKPKELWTSLINDLNILKEKYDFEVDTRKTAELYTVSIVKFKRGS